MRFHKLLEGLRSNLDATTLLMTRAAIPLLEQAQKFFLGDIGAYPSTAIGYEELFHLPFPSCAFESVLPVIEGGEKPQRIMFTLARHDGERTIMICYHMFAATKEFHELGAISFNRRSQVVETHMLKLYSEHQGVLKQLMFMQTRHVLRAIRVLNCANVIAEDITPPLALNKKRVAQGKPPIFSYKVLKLKSSVRRSSYLGGTHDSPPIHLRRGHFKTIRGREFWWSPHLVGNKKRGMVVKDYDASALSPVQQEAA